MPEKDGSEDKKSTKSVVNKKQKQFMNQEEQLDLSSVAESFGGQIVGEPVELDEFAVSVPLGTAALIKTYGIPLAMTALGAYGTSRQMQGKPLIPTIPNLGIKDKAKKVFSKIKNVFKSKKINRNVDKSFGDSLKKNRDRTINTKDLTPELERRRKQFDKDTYSNTLSNFFNRFRKNKNNNQSNKNKNNKSNKSTNLAIAGASGMGIQKTISTLTQGKKKGGGGFRMGGLPGTAHNVGRRSNPQ